MAMPWDVPMIIRWLTCAFRDRERIWLSGLVKDGLPGPSHHRSLSSILELISKNAGAHDRECRPGH